MSPTKLRPSLVVPKTSRREIVLGLAIGSAVIAALLIGLLRLSSTIVEGTLSGTITAKQFTARPSETQISIGSSGLNRSDSAGDYIFAVHVPSLAHDYNVWVDPTVYKAKQVGDSFSFPRPTLAPGRTP